MQIVNGEDGLIEYMTHAVKASPKHPVLIDKFLDNAVEVDIDAVADGARCIVAAIMAHIEEAGIHSGDSACSIPPYSLRDEIVDELKQLTYALAKEPGVVGTAVNAMEAYRALPLEVRAIQDYQATK